MNIGGFVDEPTRARLRTILKHADPSSALERQLESALSIRWRPPTIICVESIENHNQHPSGFAIRIHVDRGTVVKTLRQTGALRYSITVPFYDNAGYEKAKKIHGAICAKMTTFGRRKPEKPEAP